jgi:hypothetical protein
MFEALGSILSPPLLPPKKISLGEELDLKRQRGVQETELFLILSQPGEDNKRHTFREKK